MFLLLIGCYSHAQKNEDIKNQAIDFFNKGKWEESLLLLNQIKDNYFLETTNVNLYKKQLNSILKKQFSSKIKVHDSLYKVEFRTKNIKNQGMYDSALKKYIIPPIYDSIIAYKNQRQNYFTVIKNNESALIHRSGKTIIPLGRYNKVYATYDSLIVGHTKINFKSQIEYLNLKGELLFRFSNIDYNINWPKHVKNKLPNGSSQIIDLENQKIVFDSLDYFISQSYVYYESQEHYNANKGKSVKIILTKSKKQNQLYHLTDEKHLQKADFETSIDNFYDAYFLNNDISDLINFKKNIALKENEYRESFKYLIVKKQGKFGIFNVFKNSFYKEAVYDSITNLGNTFHKGKWINLVFEKEVVDFDYNSRKIIYKENGKLGLMNFSGEILTRANYDEIKTTYDISYLRKGKKWGFVSYEKGKAIVEPKYDYCFAVYDRIIDAYQNKKRIQLDYNGKKINSDQLESTKEYSSFDSSIYFDEKIETDRLLFKKNKLFGLDDLNYNELVPNVYNSIEIVDKTLFIVSKDNSYGLIDQNGNILIPIQYLSIQKHQPSSDDKILFIVTNKSNLQGIFNTKGENVYPFSIKTINDSKWITSSLSYLIATESNNKEFPNNEYETETMVLLKVENQLVTKVPLDGINHESLRSNFVLFLSKNSNKHGFYNLKTKTQTNAVYKAHIEIEKPNFIFAKKNQLYDTIIDSLCVENELKTPFDYFKNNFCFIKKDGKISVMNLKQEVSNFSYPVLTNFFENEVPHTYSTEFVKKGKPLFRFNTSTQSKSNGIIQWDGTIIVPPNQYEKIDLKQFDYSDYNLNPLFLPYKNNLLIGINTKNNISQVTLFTLKNQKVAQFNMSQNESWNFSKYNNSIIIKSQDSVKLFDITHQKILLQLKNEDFHEREDGTYATRKFLKDQLYKYIIYDREARFIKEVSTSQRNELELQSYLIQKEGKLGLIDSKSTVLIPVHYEQLIRLPNNNFIAERNNKYGMIDSNNEVILDFKYDTIEKRSESNYDYKNKKKQFQLLIATHNDTIELMDQNLKTIVVSSADALTFHKKIIVLKKGLLTILYNYFGEKIAEGDIDTVTFDLYDNFQLFKNGKRLFYNFNNNELTTENPYSSTEEQIKTKHSTYLNGKYYVSKNNKILHSIPITFTIEEVSFANRYGNNDDFFIIEDENKRFGLLNETLDKIILPFEYEEIQDPNNRSDYCIVAKKNGKYGMVNLKNEVILPFAYDSITGIRTNLFLCTQGTMSFEITSQNVIIKEYNQKEVKNSEGE